VVLKPPAYGCDIHIHNAFSVNLCIGTSHFPSSKRAVAGPLISMVVDAPMGFLAPVFAVSPPFQSYHRLAVGAQFT
jgi:hypothetical protein